MHKMRLKLILLKHTFGSYALLCSERGALEHLLKYRKTISKLNSSPAEQEEVLPKHSLRSFFPSSSKLLLNLPHYFSFSSS